MDASLTTAAAIRARRTGVAYSLLAYSLWGLFPIYFKLLTARPLEILAHRVTWSALFLAGVLGATRGWAWLSRAFAERAVWLTHGASSALLGVNWYVYIWAVDRGRVVDASLGYFITPLVSVVIGVSLMGEALRLGQWIAIAAAAAGVAWLTWQLGQPPWVGLILALSFGSYGALRKTSPLGALEGLMLETLLMLPFAGLYLGLLASSGASDFLRGSTGLRGLLVISGPLTSGPLLLFAAGVRLIPLSLLGILQYVSPTIQLLLGIWLWREPFARDKFVGYALIWVALAIYTSESIWHVRSARRERARA
jgi:chloramphenicol-sensitive protein RarD